MAQKQAASKSNSLRDRGIFFTLLCFIIIRGGVGFKIFNQQIRSHDAHARYLQDEVRVCKHDTEKRTR